MSDVTEPGGVSTGGYFSTRGDWSGGVLLVPILGIFLGGRAETSRADTFHLPPHFVLALTLEALIANTLRIETRNNLFDLGLRH